jgi:hypothetical protein
MESDKKPTVTVKGKMFFEYKTFFMSYKTPTQLGHRVEYIGRGTTNARAFFEWIEKTREEIESDNNEPLAITNCGII